MNGVNINLSQYIKNEYMNINNPQSSQQNAVDMLKVLSTGDTITANIVDISGNKVVANFNNVNITATLLDNIGVNIGDTVTFEVNNDNQQQVVLKPIYSESNQNQQFAAKALNAAMVPINEKTTQLVMELVKNNMSISKESLQEFSRAINSFPHAEVETLVRLSKLEIPITQENITQFENYKNYEHSISSQVNNIVNELVNVASDSNNMPVLNEILVKGGFIDGENIKASIPEEILKELSVFTQDESLSKVLQEGNLSAKEALNLLLNDNSTEESKEFADSKAFKELVNTLVKDQFLINPKDVAKENEITNFYDRVLKQTKNLEEILKDGTDATKNLGKEITMVKDNVNFMNNLNHMMTYVQIPLKFQNQNVHSDLYVFRGKGKPIDKENISALLHLDMENLGKMDIYVNLTNGSNVSTKFCMETEELLDFILEHIEILNKRLTELGYNVSYDLKLASTEHDFVKEFVDDKVETDSVINRFSFDVRA